MRALRGPQIAAALRDRWLLALSLVVALPGIWWGLPGSESWAPDAASPRGVGLFAIAETYLPGHHHIYPPLHYALLTVLTIPVHLWTLARSGFDARAFAIAQQDVWPMTIIEVVARAVSVVMALATIRNIARLAGGGLLAGACAALYAPFAYYAKLGNLDIPALCWATSCLCAMRARNSKWTIVYAVCAALTKDQAVGLLVLPGIVYFWQQRRQAKLLGKYVLAAVAAYALASGALTNPSGFAARIGELLGPASQSWANHPKSWQGRVDLVVAIVRELGDASSWPIVVLAAVGVYLGRKRPLLALAALSFFATFALGARRSEPRFVMPMGLLLLPYAASTLRAARAKLTHTHPALYPAMATAALLPSLWSVLSMNATLIVDARYSVETYLAKLPADKTVAYIGGPKFAPRFPHGAMRPGPESLDSRSGLPGLREVVAPLAATDADVLVVSTEFRDVAVGSAAPFGVNAYVDAESAKFFGSLPVASDAGEVSSIGYRLVAKFGCSLPLMLKCRPIHGSAGGELRVFERVTPTPRRPQ
jgi:hypothetical protein